MTAIQLRSGFDVHMRLAAGDDQFICDMARTSTIGADAFETTESAGLIGSLMRKRHGGPFEHGFMNFRITAPIRVWREFMRHRIGTSYSEESARYKILDGVFYMPGVNRKLVQVGKPMDYKFEEGSPELLDLVRDALLEGYETSWEKYEFMLENGAAKELAAFVLNTGIYSTCHVSMNPRSIMHFLSLRVESEKSTFPSNPQWEINQVANQMEHYFKRQWPLTHEAFVRHGRVAP